MRLYQASESAVSLAAYSGGLLKLFGLFLHKLNETPAKVALIFLRRLASIFDVELNILEAYDYAKFITPT